MERWCTWSEANGPRVKTLAIGQVTRNQREEVCTQQLSYCSRLGAAASFEEATLVETHRRGLSRASEVCAVQDGAEWLQGLVDYHRADAVRILDFAHAAEYLNEIGQAVQAAWKAPTSWSSKHASKGQACGFHRHNVNPMLVLRNAVCNREWKQTWEASLVHRQAKSHQRLESAFWFLVIWGVQLHRLSHPPVAVATAPMAEALERHQTARPGSGYSWRKPFLRRPPAFPVATEEVCAKK